MKEKNASIITNMMMIGVIMMMKMKMTRISTTEANDSNDEQKRKTAEKNNV